MNTTPVAIITRAELLQTGQLVDVTESAKAAGWRLPVAVSHRVYKEIIAKDANPIGRIGREVNIMVVTLEAAKKHAATDGPAAGPNFDRFDFEVMGHRLSCHIGPGDGGEDDNVITILYPNED